MSPGSSVETQGRVGEGEKGEGSGPKDEEEEEEVVRFGASAAAPSSLLASLATGQCGVGGRMLGSNLNTISLCGTEKQRRERNLVEKTNPQTNKQTKTSFHPFLPRQHTIRSD